MADGKTLRDRYKEITRKEILNAAQEEFSQNAFNDVNVEDIANRAKISRTTVYNYFTNKDEIYFQLGTMAFKRAHAITQNQVESALPDTSGLDQFLSLCEFTFKTIETMPLVFEILSEFYTRVNKHNLRIEEMHDDIAQSVGTSRYDEIRDQFDEPYLVDFYVQLQKVAFLWGRVVERGKNDGTIRQDIDTDHIVHFMNLTVVGIIEQMLHRQATMDRIDLEHQTVMDNTFELISMYLQTDGM